MIPSAPPDVQSAVKWQAVNISYDFPRPCKFPESPARVRGARARQTQNGQTPVLDTEETPVSGERRLRMSEAEAG